MNEFTCCRDVYSAQVGGGYIPYYVPQRGGSIFGSVLKGVGNFFKSKVAPSLITHGADFLQDVVSGRNVAESAKQRGIEALQSTINRTLQSPKTQRRNIKAKRRGKSQQGRKRRRQL
jgi:hypothetical protein